MKNKNKYILASSLLVVTSLFTACSQSASSVLDKDPIYAQNLQYTKIGKIIQNDEVSAILNVTYLNSVDKKKYNTNNKQYFIIGTYIINENDSKYELQMNGQNYISSQEIKKDDDLYKNIASKNHWGKYQLVSFSNTKDNNINVSYTDLKSKKNTIVTFIKE